MSSASQLRPAIRHPAVNRHIEALEAIERLADIGRRGRDPVAALKEIRAAALASLGRQETPPLPRLFVRVTSADQDDWYAESVGEVFEVVPFGSGYLLAIDYDRGYSVPWCHIAKPDAEVVR